MRYGQQGTPIYPIGLPGGGFAPMQGYAIPGYMPYGVPPQGYPGMGPGGQGGFQMMPGMMGGPGGGPGVPVSEMVHTWSLRLAFPGRVRLGSLPRQLAVGLIVS